MKKSGAIVAHALWGDKWKDGGEWRLTVDAGQELVADSDSTKTVKHRTHGFVKGILTPEKKKAHREKSRTQPNRRQHSREPPSPLWSNHSE